jgi:hypothetical protein
VNSQPVARHPRNTLGRRRIEIRENNEIVTAREHSFDDRIDSARAARDSKAGGKSVRNPMVS